MADHHPALSRRTYLTFAGMGAAILAGCQSGPDGNGAQEPSPRPSVVATGSTSAQASSESPGARDSATPATPTDPPPSEVDEAGARIAEAEAALANLSFDGALFDTHAHWGMAGSFGQDDLTLSTLTTRQRAHEVGASVLFTPMRDLATDYLTTIEALVEDSIDYLPFMTPDETVSTMDDLREVYEGREDVFYGLGEMVFYQGPLQGQPITAEPMPSYFEFAAEEDLVLMLHPTEEQAEGLGTMLSQFSETTLLLHGFELLYAGDTLVESLATYDNLYWSYDAATMTGGLLVRAQDATDFIDRFDRDRERYVARVNELLPRLLEAAPDRVMWGTDVATDYSVNPDVYARLIDFSREVIDGLPAEQRDAFAYENAVSLFDS